MQPDHLIAADISEIVNGLIPGAIVSVFAKAREAGDPRSFGSDWDLVIADNQLLGGPGNALRDWLDGLNCLRIQLDSLGERDRDGGQGWLSIQFPFSEMTMRDALAAWAEWLNRNK